MSNIPLKCPHKCLICVLNFDMHLKKKLNVLMFINDKPKCNVNNMLLLSNIHVCSNHKGIILRVLYISANIYCKLPSTDVRNYSIDLR